MGRRPETAGHLPRPGDGPSARANPLRGLLGAIRRHPDAAALTLIAVVAALLRLAFLYRVPVILTGDSQSHYLPGYDLAFGNDLDPELRRPPGYAVFVAATIWLFGEELRGLAFAQHLLGVGNALLTYLLARLSFGRPVGIAAGLLAGLLVALNGALVLSGQSVMTETLFTTLLLATLALLLLAGRTSHWGWALAAGLVLGAASLTRPVAQLLVALVPLAFVVYAKRPLTPRRGALHPARGPSAAPDPRVTSRPPLPDSGGGGEPARMAGVVTGVAATATGAGSRPGPGQSQLWGRVWPVARGTALVGLGAALIMVPWMLRNLAEHGTFTAAGGLGRSLIARTIKYDEGYFDEAREAPPGDLKAEVRQFIRGKRNTIRNSRSVRSTQAGLMKEFGLTQAESDRLMRQVAQEAIAERPGYYVVGSLQMAWQIVLGKEKEDTYSERWVMRSEKDWVEQWETRVDHLLTPSTPTEASSMATAQWLTELFQPAALGPALPILAGAGLALAAAAARPALLPGLAGLGILLASAALDGPVPRYRYPLDPLIALLAAGTVTLALGWLVQLARRGRPAALSPSGARPVPEASR